MTPFEHFAIGWIFTSVTMLQLIAAWKLGRKLGQKIFK